MKSYEIPPSKFLDPAQAQAAINRLTADVRGDPEHPMMNRGHPQHDDFITYLHALGERASPPPPPPQPLGETERGALQEELDGINGNADFMSGRLKNGGHEGREEHRRLVARRDALYVRLAEGDAAATAAAEADETEDTKPPDDNAGGHTDHHHYKRIGER